VTRARGFRYKLESLSKQEALFRFPSERGRSIGRPDVCKSAVCIHRRASGCVKRLTAHTSDRSRQSWSNAI